MSPLVSVICLCYNHERFVLNALESVLQQTYLPIQLIVVDDCSTDNSRVIISKFLTQHPEIAYINFPTNQGNCRAFNQGLKIARGSYVIDLAADDVLTPSRVERGVALMLSRPDCGVQFSDAEIIDANGARLGFHSDRFPHQTIPSGRIFAEVLSRYFINSPTMMIRKSLLDDLGGYDESLAYEDFDFWVRSTPRTVYLYIPEPLVKRRYLSTSMGKVKNNLHLSQQRSTLRICQKALTLCTVKEEFAALKKRIWYELRHALRVGAWDLAWDYWNLWRKIP